MGMSNESPTRSCGTLILRTKSCIRSGGWRIDHTLGRFNLAEHKGEPLGCQHRTAFYLLDVALEDLPLNTLFRDGHSSMIKCNPNTATLTPPITPLTGAIESRFELSSTLAGALWLSACLGLAAKAPGAPANASSFAAGPPQRTAIAVTLIPPSRSASESSWTSGRFAEMAMKPAYLRGPDLSGPGIAFQLHP